MRIGDRILMNADVRFLEEVNDLRGPDVFMAPYVAGDVVPGIVVRVNNPQSANVKLFLDGDADLWLKEVPLHQGDAPWVEGEILIVGVPL
jgi:hypothetical protein